MHRADDEEGAAEQHSLVVEHAGHHEHTAADPGERRVVGEQRRDLREREHEDEVEEQLSRRDAMLVVDCQRGHPARPYPAISPSPTPERSHSPATQPCPAWACGSRRRGRAPSVRPDARDGLQGRRASLRAHAAAIESGQSTSRRLAWRLLVVSFDGVSRDRVREMQSEMEGSEPPEGVPAKEIIVLHDADAERSVVIIFFDSEEDYRRGDEILSGMPADDTPGRRTAVAKYDVAVRMAM